MKHLLPVVILVTTTLQIDAADKPAKLKPGTEMVIYNKSAKFTFAAANWLSYNKLMKAMIAQDEMGVMDW